MANNKNILIPVHRKLSEDESQVILEKFNLKNLLNLPKISIKDAALVEIEVVAGDIVEITRHSFAGESKYYRVVIE